MDEELKDIYRKVTNYLKKKYMKVIGWVLFILGILWVIGGFITPVTFFLGIPLTIIGGLILKKELKIIATFLKPYLGRLSFVGPGLLILGIIFLVAGIIFFIGPLPGWGILFIVIGVPLTAARLVLKHHVKGDWGHFIGEAQGKAEEIFENTKHFIKQSGVTSITAKRQELLPGYIRGMLGKRREFLVIKEKHFRLKPYQVLVNAKDYGNNLDVVWYLTYRLSPIRALLTIIPFVSFIPKKIEELDLFDLQDLRAFNTVCHHAVLSAVEVLMKNLKQDTSKIDRSTRGFLGIS